MIPILYGSQTGNGIHLSRMLTEKITSSFVLSIDEFNILNINDFPFIIFIVSTHGDGQPPFNMSRFFKIATAQNMKLFSFKYAILGLGDSSYPKYNYCARILSERLKILGAVQICFNLSNSQDQNGIYDGYRKFENNVLDYIRNNSLNYPSIDKIDCVKNNSKLSARVIENRKITPPGYGKEVFEIILEIPLYKEFYPGDCISIVPENIFDSKITSCLKDSLNFSDDQIEYLRKNIDFFAYVQQTHFKTLSTFTGSDLHSKKLLEIYNDYDLYHEYVLVPRRNIIEIISDFDLKIPFDFLKDLNRIYPRYFSCTQISCPIYKINDKCDDQCRCGILCYSILYNVVEYDTYINTKRQGLCTKYLTTLKRDDIIDIEIEKSNLFFDDKKLLFFSTGTGITLPRSVIHFFKNKEIKVFYGFRYYDKDQLCKDEFKNVEVYNASSKDDGKYIMDLYRTNPVDNIDEWLVFVSGNSRLNKEISNLLKEIHSKDVIFQSETW